MKFALLFAAAFAALPACAVTSYDFSFEGRQTHFFDAWECPSMVCSVPLIMQPWLGEFSVTAPDGDGVFDVTGLSLTNEGDAGIAVSSSGRSPPFSSLTSLLITVTDGTVTSIVGLARPPLTSYGRSIALVGWELPSRRLLSTISASRSGAQRSRSLRSAPCPSRVSLRCCSLASRPPRRGPEGGRRKHSSGRSQTRISAQRALEAPSTKLRVPKQRV
jgi:hypothetical protein